MNNEKEQKTMEWLMTYGWAVISVFVFIGILAYFYFSPAVSVECDGVDIDDYKIEFCENYNLTKSNHTRMYKNEVICLDEYNLQYTFEVNWDDMREKYIEECDDENNLFE